MISTSLLQNQYEQFQYFPEKISEEDFIKAVSICRLDARLAQILVQFLIQYYSQLNPFKIYLLRENLLFPETLGVLVEFAKAASANAAFKAWSASALFELKPSTWQMFFIQSSRPKPERDLKIIQRSLKPYVKWGFFSDEDLYPSKKNLGAKKKSYSLLSKSQRLKILKELLNKNKSITVNDYIEACAGQIHRRAAERDLQSIKGIQSRGNTRTKVYFQGAND